MLYRATLVNGATIDMQCITGTRNRLSELNRGMKVPIAVSLASMNCNNPPQCACQFLVRHVT
jgi:hypothetical protein